jgi:hypothetical protein
MNDKPEVDIYQLFHQKSMKIVTNMLDSKHVSQLCCASCSYMETLAVAALDTLQTRDYKKDFTSGIPIHTYQSC